MSKELTELGVLLAAYKRMLLIRRMEEALIDYYFKNKVMSFVHFYVGQEAVAVGVCDALSSDDKVLGNHRSHGHYLAKGGDPGRMVAELLGRSTGCCGGNGGSMHMIDKSVNFIGSTPILGSVAPISAGSALTQKLKRSPHITASFFGDGASEEGVVYETLNFAALFKLPLLLVVENNLYSVMTKLHDRRSTDHDLGKIAEGFGVQYLKADGNDYLDVSRKAKSLVEGIKSDRKPALLECITFRHMAHSAPICDDKIGYREIDTPENRSREDSVLKLERIIIGAGGEADLRSIQAEVEAVVVGAMDFGVGSPYPEQTEIFKHVYHE
jgi:TPP-dependent pyruvate/acetoin dehydrogenase alpha subunit